jgi:plastocyanin
MIAAMSASLLGSLLSGEACTPGPQVELKWNAHASEWGAYEITGCEGVNPKLLIAAGQEYTFDQSHASNWYHPIGFAYIAGGAHTECVDGDGAMGECPELGGEDAGTTIQYYVDDVPVISDESGFGLDAYEPLFFNSQDHWGESAFKVTLNIPTSAPFTKIYYFCHIHAGMSAEIEITGSAGGNILNPAVLGRETEASALAIFDGIQAADQKSVSTHDQACGTYNTFAEDTKSSCKNSHFLCGDGAGGAYETCLEAIDCKMHHDMAISVEAGASKFATFARQMIPHHQNAVSMAKSLIKFHTAADYANAGAAEDDDHAAAENLARNIINVQNAQIQMLAGWLDANPDLAGTSHKCYDQPEGAMCSGKGGKNECPAGTHCDCGGHRRHLLFASMGGKQCRCHSN